MAKLFLYCDRPSNGFNALRAALDQALEHRTTKLRNEGSTITPGATKRILNWGCSSNEMVAIASRFTGSQVANRAEAVNRAVNKATALATLNVYMRDHHVPYVTTPSQALDLLKASRCRLYCRTRLSGHSGEGIIILMRADDPQAARPAVGYERFIIDERTEVPDLPGAVQRARLFTIGHVGRRQEWRVHVFNGEVIFSQMKRRREGSLDEGSSVIRNVANGWVYTASDEAECTEETKRVARIAISALGLTFGAVDLVVADNHPRVLEVNTAPGLDEDGTALQRYVTAIRRWVDGPQDETLL